MAFERTGSAGIGVVSDTFCSPEVVTVALGVVAAVEASELDGNWSGISPVGIASRGMVVIAFTSLLGATNAAAVAATVNMTGTNQNRR